ncbi:response regulator [Pseudomonas frederiksbergensis]|uniref:response regulator n=1 Tax=Pseudomonas frederiksbergensis TaxID=104087 RepID=UPI003D256FBC
MDVEKRNPSVLTGWAIVVEDYAPLRMLLVESLTEIGLHSLDFETADAALILLMEAHSGCPLVIADQGPPGRLQGAAFIEMVKARWPATSAILTSGFELDPATVPSSAIYLQKPYSIDALVNAVESCLQQDGSGIKI